jgi:hypothetical protein
MASYGSGGPASADLPGVSDDPDDQQPEYQLIDHGPPPRDDEADGLVDDADDITDQQPAYELVDHSVPPPDDIVIAREEARLHGIQRSWLLGTFIGLFVVVILSDIGLSAGLPPREWAQLKPEIDTVRTSMFAVLLVIIGYFFGERRHR